MNATPNQATEKKTVLIVRWIARILSALILLFWGYFIVAHLFGDPAQFLALTAKDALQLAMMVLWLVGLAAAWRWELAGAIVAVAAGLIGGLLNPNAVALAAIPAVPALLFLYCWWMSRVPRQ